MKIVWNPRSTIFIFLPSSEKPGSDSTKKSRTSVANFLQLHKKPENRPISKIPKYLVALIEANQLNYDRTFFFQKNLGVRPNRWQKFWAKLRNFKKIVNCCSLAKQISAFLNKVTKSRKIIWLDRTQVKRGYLIRQVFHRLLTDDSLQQPKHLCWELPCLKLPIYHIILKNLLFNTFAAELLKAFLNIC